jgi:hypothetical protein
LYGGKFTSHVDERFPPARGFWFNRAPYTPTPRPPYHHQPPATRHTQKKKGGGGRKSKIERARDFEISRFLEGALTEEPRPDANNARSQRPAIKGNWRVSCSCLCVETPVVAHRCFALPRSTILCGCINIPGRQVNAVWGRYPTACTIYEKQNVEFVGGSSTKSLPPSSLETRVRRQSCSGHSSCGSSKGIIAGIGKCRCAEALQTLSGSPLPIIATYANAIPTQGP